VVTRLELARLKTEIEKIDPNAFITMTSVKDLKGGMIKKRQFKGYCDNTLVKRAIPVTPPSINPFGRRKPFNPNPADKTPRVMNNTSFNNRITLTLRMK